MRMLLILPLIAILASSATARNQPSGTRSAAAFERALANRVAGEPRRCVPTREANISVIHDGSILFRRDSRLIYRNDMRGCGILREDDILQTRLIGITQICDGDITQIVERVSGIGKGACVFGPFVPYERPG